MSTDIAKTIVISDNITNLGANMFYGCSIGDLTVPVSIPFYECRAFYGPYNTLHNVTITKGTGWGHCCDFSMWASTRCPWNNASDLESVTIEEGVVYLGLNMFYTCHTKTLVLPNSLATLEMNVFKDSEITYLTIPITLNATWFDDKPAFCSVSGIEKITFTPGDSGNGFDYAAYEDMNCWYQHTPWYQCRSTLKEIVFADGIKSIGSDAFRELNITSVVIPDSVESLGNHTFYHCDKLTDITVPVTLDTVGNTTWPAFDQCNAITTVRLTAGDTGLGWNYATAHLPVWCDPSHKVSTIILDSGITHIGVYAFDGLTFLGFDGSELEPTAENLSGHTFIGNDGNMHITD